MSRFTWFVLGIVCAFAVLFVGGYLFLVSGGVSMQTTASALPMERTVAKMALKASLKGATEEKDPLPLNDANLLAGAKVYKTDCAVCHGLPGQPKGAIAKGEFPVPPQLFEDMVTDDPEGVTYWKVTHGIRLSGMPGFNDTISQDGRWQVTMLLAHADKLPGSVKDVLK